MIDSIFLTFSVFLSAWSLTEFNLFLFVCFDGINYIMQFIFIFCIYKFLGGFPNNSSPHSLKWHSIFRRSTAGCSIFLLFCPFLDAKMCYVCKQIFPKKSDNVIANRIVFPPKSWLIVKWQKPSLYSVVGIEWFTCSFKNSTFGY